MVTRDKINKTKAELMPIFIPLFVICTCGCGIWGSQFTQFYWQWPLWLATFVAVPISSLIGMLLSGVITIAIMMLKACFKEHSDTGTHAGRT